MLIAAKGEFCGNDSCKTTAVQQNKNRQLPNYRWAFVSGDQSKFRCFLVTKWTNKNMLRPALNDSEIYVIGSRARFNAAVE